MLCVDRRRDLGPLPGLGGDPGPLPGLGGDPGPLPGLGGDPGPLPGLGETPVYCRDWGGRGVGGAV